MLNTQDTTTHTGSRRRFAASLRVAGVKEAEAREVWREEPVGGEQVQQDGGDGKRGGAPADRKPP